MAFLLATATRLISSALALLWTRWLLQTMGDKTYGLFISFQALVSIGTMGDLGLGWTVGIETNRLLGARRLDELRSFLAEARTVFLILAAAVGGGFALTAPWLAPALGFGGMNATSTWLLFAVGAVMISGTVLGSFSAGLSNACQNLTWPPLPTLLVTQAALAMHLCLARAGAVLWLQLLPYAMAGLVMMVLPWIFVRISNPEFSALAPVRIKLATARRLFSQSFWVYLWSFGFLVYTTTDRLVINRYFGPEFASLYYLNYKPAELAMFLLVTLTFVSLTKIIQWHFAPGSEDKTKAREAAVKLQRVEAFLGVTAGLIYLAFNDLFIQFWLGGGHGVALLLQALFAANLAVTVSGDAGTKVAGQISARGTVFAGAMVALTAVMNLVLSVWAARAGYFSGIAAATLFAQLFFGVTTGYFTARELGLSKTRWIFRASVLPMVVISMGYLVRSNFTTETVSGTLYLILALFGMVLTLGLILGINRQLLREEWSILRAMVKP